jgi:hypothetical protein
MHRQQPANPSGDPVGRGSKMVHTSHLSACQRWPQLNRQCALRSGGVQIHPTLTAARQAAGTMMIRCA